MSAALRFCLKQMNMKDQILSKVIPTRVNLLNYQ
jgi:hypothetical protein